jgi:hypothetical protein
VRSPPGTFIRLRETTALHGRAEFHIRCSFAYMRILRRNPEAEAVVHLHLRPEAGWTHGEARKCDRQLQVDRAAGAGMDRQRARHAWELSRALTHARRGSSEGGAMMARGRRVGGCRESPHPLAWRSLDDGCVELKEKPQLTTPLVQ